MQRVVIYLKRRTDLLQPSFFAWWLGQHRALAEQLPGLRQYVISLAADAPEGPFAGMAERYASGAAGSRSGAEAVSRRLHAKVKPGMEKHSWLLPRCPLCGCLVGFPPAGSLPAPIS